MGGELETPADLAPHNRQQAVWVLESTCIWIIWKKQNLPNARHSAQISLSCSPWPNHYTEWADRLQTESGQ